MPRPIDHFRDIEATPPAEDLIGIAPATAQLFKLLRLAAKRDQPVLFQGEVGTGKTRLASVLHELSDRRESPFLRINCAAINESQLLDDLLDWFVQAHGGMLFFDELNATSVRFQAKLLQFLQSAAAGRMHTESDDPINVRIVASASCDLNRSIGEGQFREDLYWYLNVLPVEVPPLRRRKEDIEPLTRWMLKTAADSMKRPVKKIAPEAVAALEQYAFPGNLSELFNYIRRAVALASGNEITANLLPVAVVGDIQDAQSVVFRPADDEALVREFVYSQISKAGPDDEELYRRIVSPVEKELLAQILDACRDTQTKAAKRLGINRNTLYKKLVEHDLVKPKPDESP